MPTPSIDALRNIATRLRIDSIQSTTAAGSGHPTSCMSAADVVAALFFSEMRYDPQNPKNPDNDRFVLSKGHAAPVLYAAWAEAGLFPRAELLKLRRIDSDLEGHPTPRLSFVDVATGSLGQGICAAIGIAANARLIGSGYRTYVMLGDGESAEGSVWEAADIGAYRSLDNLCAIVDVNALGQSGPTQFGHNMDELARRWTAFGWRSLVIDGHDMAAILKALKEARETTGRPSVILARTLKGKGVASVGARKGGTARRSRKAKRRTAQSRSSRSSSSPGAETPAIPRPQKSGPRQAGAGLQQARSLRPTRRGHGRHARGVGRRARGVGARGRACRRARRGRQEFHLQRPVREGLHGSFLRGLHRRAGHGRDCRWAWPRAARFPSRPRSPAFSPERRTSSGWRASPRST